MALTKGYALTRDFKAIAGSSLNVALVSRSLTLAGDNSADLQFVFVVAVKDTLATVLTHFVQLGLQQVALAVVLREDLHST